MKLRWFVGGTLLSLVSGLALAQKGPESLLPPGFDNPPAAPAQAPAQSETQRPASSSESPVSATPPLAGQSLPSASSSAPALTPQQLANLPTADQLEQMTPDELEAALGLKPTSDIPPAARRSMEQVGIISQDEGGFAPQSLVHIQPSLVRAVLDGNHGKMLSRWGHILLRRALASRLDAPDGMNPADFAALRASLLLRMGEGDAARALVQDVDTANYSPALIDAAVNAYVGTEDFTGSCPMIAYDSSARSDPQWDALGAICNAFRGDSDTAMQKLDRAFSRGSMPRIDLLLAQRYAGAAGKARRAVTIEWDGVDALTPWRYGMTLAVGLEPPDSLKKSARTTFAGMTALAPAAGLEDRAAAADVAAGNGVLSSTAMVDLYGQIYSDGTVTGDWSDRAKSLRAAYVGSDPDSRLAAMQSLWNGGPENLGRYSRQVLTAYAAARMPISAQMQDQAFDLVTSMLAAGLDRNALRWGQVADIGSPAWGLLVLAAPTRNDPVDASAIKEFIDNDHSTKNRKSGFLLAGLAALGRIDNATKASMADKLSVDLDTRSRWTSIVDVAAAQHNEALVAMLVGVGMQGTSWDTMTPRFLYHIVSALRQAGMEGEARMIAAEAVARA